MNYLDYFHKEVVKAHESDDSFYRRDLVEDIQLEYEKVTTLLVPAEYRLIDLDQRRQDREAYDLKIRQQNEEWRAKCEANTNS